jgi:hypothetical protein
MELCTLYKKIERSSNVRLADFDVGLKEHFEQLDTGNPAFLFYRYMNIQSA